MTTRLSILKQPLLAPLNGGSCLFSTGNFFDVENEGYEEFRKEFFETVPTLSELPPFYKKMVDHFGQPKAWRFYLKIQGECGLTGIKIIQIPKGFFE
jgi:hypothetical protein